MTTNTGTHAFSFTIDPAIARKMTREEYREATRYLRRLRHEVGRRIDVPKLTHDLFVFGSYSVEVL